MTDTELLEWLRAEFRSAMISRVHSRRSDERVAIEIATARPGLLIGRQGTTLTAMAEALESTLKSKVEIHLVEVRMPQREPLLVADHAARMLERGARPNDVLDVVLPMCRNAGVEGVRVRIVCDEETAERADGVVPTTEVTRVPARFEAREYIVEVWLSETQPSR